MEELSIEEKAKAYDEAIKKLRDFYRDYDTVSHLIDVKEELANLFPELCESEDEKIRKELMEFLSGKRIISNDLEGINIDKTLIWLEKQGNLTDEDMKEALRTEYEKGRADAFAEMQKEWSEEDEELLNIIIDNVKGYDAYTGGIALKFGLHENKIKWLKSIKNRVLTKQEWSKENDGILLEIISVLRNSSHWVLADKLKSIMLQNRWKPSDKQMEALNDVISSRDIKYDVLSELWKDLNKLKGE